MARRHVVLNTHSSKLMEHVVKQEGNQQADVAVKLGEHTWYLGNVKATTADDLLFGISAIMREIADYLDREQPR